MACAAAGKPSKQVRAKLDSFVVALTKKGIKLLALDFDKTIIDIHSGGTWSESVDKLIPHVRPCMRDLMESAVHRGIFVAIVTYHRQGWLIKDLLHKVLPRKVASKIYVQGNTADFMLRQRSLSTGSADSSSAMMARYTLPELNGKQAHIAAVLEEIQKDHKVTLKNEEVILMDDDINNVRIASSNGHYAFQVQQNVDYPSFESFETMLLLRGPNLEAATMTVDGRQWLRHLWAWRKVLIFVLTPLILLPLVVTLESPIAKCAYVVILMAVYWTTEALPFGVTALLPVVLFPLFEIVSSNDIASQYMNDINMLFLGGLVMATAIEHWEVHKRVALIVLMGVGHEPRRLILGMMLATWFLSMWISNTATTAMMIPIAEAVLIQLRGTTLARRNSGSDGDDLDISYVNESNGSVDQKYPSTVRELQIVVKASPGDTFDQAEEEEFNQFGKAISLSICYAASFGGIACLTGTGPNLALKAFADSVYSSRGINNPVTFGNWMAFGIPLSLLLMAIGWGLLLLLFLSCRNTCDKCFDKGKEDSCKAARVKQILKDEYSKLGPLNVKDGAPAILISILLFALPSTLPCLKSYRSMDTSHVVGQSRRMIQSSGTQEIRPLLTWKVAHEKLPWNLFLLLGGGYALSKGCEKSGMSSWMGHQMEFFKEWNQWGIFIIISCITSVMTQITSNTAIATLLLPIMSQLAMNTSVHPLYYMLPTAISSSFAYMLPVATPPNAIVLAYGRITILDMVKAGLLLNIISVPCLVAVMASVGDALYNFGAVPIEFIKANQTIVATI
ncbi:hypothetical protein Btru_001683 [Bulinus truncatus]|nr:hypothetical protein Btru_001683 [Bulinus truncatus]